mgnify:CR=1 FL=1
MLISWGKQERFHTYKAFQIEGFGLSPLLLMPHLPWCMSIIKILKLLPRFRIKMWCWLLKFMKCRGKILLCRWRLHLKSKKWENTEESMKNWSINWKIKLMYSSIDRHSNDIKGSCSWWNNNRKWRKLRVRLKRSAITSRRTLIYFDRISG